MSNSFIFVSESGHVAFKINMKEVKTNIQGNTLNVHTLLTTWVGLKGQLLKLCTYKCIFIKLSTKTYSADKEKILFSPRSAAIFGISRYCNAKFRGFLQETPRK